MSGYFYASICYFETYARNFVFIECKRSEKFYFHFTLNQKNISVTYQLLLKFSCSEVIWSFSAIWLVASVKFVDVLTCIELFPSILLLR